MQSAGCIRYFVVSCLVVLTVDALLEPDFQQYLRKNYGDGANNWLNKGDYPNKGGIGSFGGGHAPSNKRPIIFIHGLRNTAALWWQHRIVFQQRGWPLRRLIATTWGLGNVDPWTAARDTMKCAHVQQIRLLIESVSRFYNSAVDIIAYSMGAPIARKAILGGKCLETGQQLGPPLTDKVITFLSVAGANRGAQLCNFAFPGVCGLDNGLNCASRFLREINSRVGYEGRHRYAMYSTGDEVIGYFNGCFEKASMFKGATAIERQGFNHVRILEETINQQADIIGRHANEL